MGQWGDGGMRGSAGTSRAHSRVPLVLRREHQRHSRPEPPRPPWDRGLPPSLVLSSGQKAASCHTQKESPRGQAGDKVSPTAARPAGWPRSQPSETHGHMARSKGEGDIGAPCDSSVPLVRPAQHPGVAGDGRRAPSPVAGRWPRGDIGEGGSKRLSPPQNSNFCN